MSQENKVSYLDPASNDVVLGWNMAVHLSVVVMMDRNKNRWRRIKRGVILNFLIGEKNKSSGKV